RGAREDVQIRRMEPLGFPGYDLLCPFSNAPRLWQTLMQLGVRPAGLAAYAMLRVEAGTPVYGTDFDETNLAMEVNRTAQAISFTKGCYLGQEPVVRARDLGHVNRSLTGLKLPGRAALP